MNQANNLHVLLRTCLETFLLVVALTPILRDVFRAYHVVDKPGIRKIHTYPIPRLGGISIAAACAIGFYQLNVSDELAWKILPAASAMFLTGLLDDFVNLSARVKLLGQILAAGLAFWMGLRFPGPDWISLPVTIFYLLLTTNSFNLIDGMDGLCAGVGLIASLGVFLFGWFHHSLKIPVVTVPLIGASLGFLCYNYSRATIFLGDSGALLIGFLVGCAGLLWTAEPGVGALALAAPLLTVAVPFMEVALSILRRTLQGSPIFLADRGHMHHRLLDRGMSPQKVAAVLYLWAATGTALGVLLVSYEPFPLWPLLVLACSCMIACIGIHQLRYPEFQMATRLLLQGEIRKALGGKNV